jgi:hypothetical protein
MPALSDEELPPGSPPPVVEAGQPRPTGEETFEAPAPSLRGSHRRRPTQSEAPGPTQPSPAPSSTASPPGSPGRVNDPLTAGAPKGAEGKPEDKPERPRAAPEDVKAALTEGCDITLELMMAGASALHRQLTKAPLRDDAWKPTDDERRRISTPAGRIINRHLDLDGADMDTVDMALIGTGLLSVTLRSTMGRKTEPQKPAEEAPSAGQ